MQNVFISSSTVTSGSFTKGGTGFGVVEQNYGPTTANTGFYNTITPPAGGYTFYKTKTQNGPIIKVASNDAELITYVQKETGITYSISGALQWAATQNDIAVANFDYPNIITSGSILHLDAGYTLSSPRTGSILYDLSGNGNNGNLFNAPTFNSSNSGSIVFNGTNQYANINSSANILSKTSYTKIAWFYVTSLSTDNNIISGGSSGQHAFWLFGSNKLNAGHNGTWNRVVSTTTIAINTWYCGAVTFNTTSGWVLYVNGVQEATNADTTTFTGNGDISLASYLSAGNYLTGRIAIAQVYNRVLSSTEILTNYNALKGRFGL